MSNILEFKGTKGEWEVVKDRVFIGNTTVQTKDCDICDVEEIGEETEANAKLISSAPELLKALIKIKEYCFENETLTNDIHSIAEKAIEKALK